MSKLVSRAYAGASDLILLIQFAQKAAEARWPRSTYKKVGDVVWGAPGSGPNDNIRLWFDGAGLIAYGWFEPPMNLEFDVLPALPSYDLAGKEILQWGENRRCAVAPSCNESVPKALAMLGYRSVCLTEVLDSDSERVVLVKQLGYSRTDGYAVLYGRSLKHPLAESPILDPPLCLRHATDRDIEARVDLHRDAWSVWGLSGATVENYRRLRAAPVYDPELDVVLDDGAGRLLAYCIGWLDTANSFGHFEPVGCRPAFTRRGYARAVTIEGMRRMRARGMHTALVATAGVNHGARALYPSCGFVELERAHHYVKGVAL